MGISKSIIRALVGGEFSPFMEGRTDHAKYPFSAKRLLNYVLTPQGPAIRRSGSKYIARASKTNPDAPPRLIPFVRSDEVTLMMEFYTNDVGAGKIAFYTDEGPLIDNDDVKVTVDTPYTQEQLSTIRYVQSVDFVYLWHSEVPTKKLKRYDTFDFRLEDVEFVDGPFLPLNTGTTRLTPSSTGGATDTLTAPDSRSFGDSALGQPWKAFDKDHTTYWISDNPQTGILGYMFAAPVVATGYCITLTKNGDPELLLAVDFGPADWTFEASNDGVVWTVLDTKYNFVAYSNYRSPWFNLKEVTTTAYKYYRLNITGCTRNHNFQVRVGEFEITTAASTVFDIEASADAKINGLKGFLAGDVGRQIRLRGSDNLWRSVVITARADSRHITVKLQDLPLRDTNATLDWRLGIFSNTTGWPSCGVFFEDRLFMAGCREYPDVITATKTGGYGEKEVFSQTDVAGVVADDNGLVFFLNARELSRIQWLQTDERGLIIGTSKSEWIMKAPDNQNLTARNVIARNSTKRGSAAIEPVRIDQALLFVQRSGKTIREIGFNYEADGYRAPSMSLFAAHLGSPGFKELAYCAEPNSIVYVRRGDGSLGGMTYNKEENVLGWHVHTYSGVIEAVCEKPSDNDAYDQLWFSILRENGIRSIEHTKLTLDYDDNITETWMMDAAVQVGPGATQISELGHLRNLPNSVLVGLIDGKKFVPTVKSNGVCDLPYPPLNNAIVGIGYGSLLETSRPEVANANGTLQGKRVRANACTLRLWKSIGGHIGRPETINSPEELVPIEYAVGGDQLDPIKLFTGDVEINNLPDVTQATGALIIYQPPTEPYPLNVVALMPTLGFE